jgi:hypothetical protein
MNWFADLTQRVPIRRIDAPSRALLKPAPCESTSPCEAHQTHRPPRLTRPTRPTRLTRPTRHITKHHRNNSRPCRLVFFCKAVGFPSPRRARPPTKAHMFVRKANVVSSYQARRPSQRRRAASLPSAASSRRGDEPPFEAPVLRRRFQNFLARAKGVLQSGAYGEGERHFFRRHTVEIEHLDVFRQLWRSRASASSAACVSSRLRCRGASWTL